jgi:hypothetical protein
MYKVEIFSCMIVKLMIYDESNAYLWNTNHLMTLLFSESPCLQGDPVQSKKNSSLKLKFSTLNMFGNFHIYQSVLITFSRSVIFMSLENSSYISVIVLNYLNTLTLAEMS